MAEETKGFELMEPRAPEALVPEHGLWQWFAGGGVLLVLLVVVAVLLGRRKSAAVDPRAIRNAAYAEAGAALDATTAEDARDAAVKSSLILRRYLSSAANDPALFETHEEFIARHDALLMLTADARAAAAEGFSRLAALKYAPESPSTEPSAVTADSRALLETLHRGFAA